MPDFKSLKLIFWHLHDIEGKKKIPSKSEIFRNFQLTFYSKIISKIRFFKFASLSRTEKFLEPERIRTSWFRSRFLDFTFLSFKSISFLTKDMSEIFMDSWSLLATDKHHWVVHLMQGFTTWEHLILANVIIYVLFFSPIPTFFTIIQLKAGQASTTIVSSFIFAIDIQISHVFIFPENLLYCCCWWCCWRWGRIYRTCLDTQSICSAHTACVACARVVIEYLSLTSDKYFPASSTWKKVSARVCRDQRWIIFYVLGWYEIHKLEFNYYFLITENTHRTML